MRLILGLAVAALALPALADQSSVDVRANIRGTCKIDAVNPVDFGDLDQGASAPDRTAPGDVRYWCSKGLQYSVTIGIGNNAQGTARRMKGQATTNSSEFLPYEIVADSALSGNGRGPQTPETFRMTGKVKGPDYNSLSVGAFLDTLVVTISP
jgi:spore coat protein U-like protein